MVTTNYIWDGESYLTETDETNTVTALFTNLPDRYTNLVSQRRGGVTNYAHFDALGSTKQLTDQTATVTDEFEYDAWGNEISRTGTTEMPFQYVGRYGYHWDEEADAFYILARAYQPTIARWWSVDSIWRFFYPYLYAFNSPCYFNDPSGDSPTTVDNGAFRTVTSSLMTIVSWIDKFNANFEIQEDPGNFLKYLAAAESRGIQMTALRIHKLKLLITELGISANPEPPSALTPSDYAQLVSSKEYRAITRLQIRIKCCLRPLELRTRRAEIIDSTADHGWTPLRPESTHLWSTIYVAGEGFSSVSNSEAKPGSMCATAAIAHGFRIGRHGQAVAETLVPGVPWASAVIGIVLCCDGREFYVSKGSHFPSHRLYEDAANIRQRLQANLPKFLYAGAVFVTPESF